MRAGASLLPWVVVAAFAASVPVARAEPKRKKVAPLVVKRFLPKAGAKNVAIYSDVTIVFGKPIWLETVTNETAFIRKTGGEPILADVRLGGHGKSLVLVPRAPLEPSAEYEVVVRPGVEGVKAGATLKAERVSRFSTDTRLPQVLAVRGAKFEWLVATMTEGRAFHTATTLPGGRVLLAGGMTDYEAYADAGDVYDPTTKEFLPAGGTLRSPRAGHVAVPTAGGAMLVGGSNASGALATTDVYDEADRAFREGPAMAEARDYVAAVTLQNGALLVTGGLAEVAGRTTYRKSAEILDPGAEAFRPTSSAPLAPRAGHTLTVLADGRVLVVGGDSRFVAATAEVFDPATETFTAIQYTGAHRPGLVTTHLQATDDVLLVGGMRTPYVFDPADSSFRPVLAPTAINRFAPTASLLPDGTVLIAGGLQLGKASLVFDSMDLFVPVGEGVVQHTDAHFREPRFGHTATVLADGAVLFAGGVGTADELSLTTAELYRP